MKTSHSGKFLGSVTIGERGQIVIPADARKSFNLKSGDKLVVFAKEDMLSFVPADNFSIFLDEATKLMSKIKNRAVKEA